MNQSKRAFRYGLLAIFVVAGLWRASTAATLPAISRDGVTFCWYARDLGEQGHAYLRSPAAQQHPLFPTMILAVQRTARLLGAPDSPLTWQRSGQLLCWLAGMAVIGLSGAMAIRLVRRLELPVDEHLTALVAMLMAALLDLNVWLASDVMSDQVHLAFYLAAVLLLLKLDNLPAALGCGIFSGLAFLTRQEGFVAAAAGLVVLIAHRRQTAWRKVAARAAVLLFGFLMCAVPYWSAVGDVSQKKDPLDWFRKETTAGLAPASDTFTAPPIPACLTAGPDSGQRPTLAHGDLAKLETLELPWYALLPQALYKLLRAGRVVIPLLAILPLVNLRRRLLDPALGGVTACAAGHFALTLILLERYGYLSPRHMLVIVMLLVPFAAMLLARVLRLLLDIRRPWLGGSVVALGLLPLAVYALRLPNAQDRFLADAAAWLTAHEPDIASQRLLSGSSPRRIAFYADMRWEYWPESPEAYVALSRQIRAGGRGYFALEVGPGFEREGNRELIERLRGDEQLAPHLGPVHVRPGPDEQTKLYLAELQPAQRGEP